MSILFAITYPDAATGQAALETVHGLEESGALQVIDHAFLQKSSDGKLENQDAKHPVVRSGGKGLVAGLLAGSLLTIPVVGLVAGAAAGVAIAKNRHSADQSFSKFADDVANGMQPGESVLILLAESEGRERVIHELGRHGGRLDSADVSPEQLAKAQAEFDRLSAGA